MNSINLVNNSLVSVKSFNASQSESLPPIGVFWDIENCTPPHGKLRTLSFTMALRERFFKGFREEEFLVVCDVHNLNKIMIDELNNAMVTVAHVSSFSKNASDEKLKQSIRRFANTHTSPATIILISGDINFASELADLRYRNNYYVILIHNKYANASLVSFPNESYLFEDFFMQDTPMLQHFTQLQAMPTRVFLRVENLPLVWNKASGLSFDILFKQVKAQVMSFNGDTAILAVPDVHHALRACARYDNLSFYGSRLRVVMLERHKHEMMMMHERNLFQGLRKCLPVLQAVGFIDPNKRQETALPLRNKQAVMNGVATNASTVAVTSFTEARGRGGGVVVGSSLPRTNTANNSCDKTQVKDVEMKVFAESVKKSGVELVPSRKDVLVFVNGCPGNKTLARGDKIEARDEKAGTGDDKAEARDYKGGGMELGVLCRKEVEEKMEERTERRRIRMVKKLKRSRLTECTGCKAVSVEEGRGGGEEGGKGGGEEGGKGGGEEGRRGGGEEGRGDEEGGRSGGEGGNASNKALLFLNDNKTGYFPCSI